MPERKDKHILILTADAGFGHRRAAMAIAAALQETHGDECSIDIVNPMEDERVPAVLRNSSKDYDRQVREIPELYRLGYEASDGVVSSVVIERSLMVLLFDVMRDVVRRHEPDAIVTTYLLYQAPLAAVYAITRRFIPLLTVVTDLAPVHRLWFNDVVDLCLVPTLQVRDQAYENGLAKDKVQVTGIPVHPDIVREHRAPSEIRAEMGWTPNVTTALAVGSKRVTHLEGVLRALNHSGLPLQLAVVAGGDDALYRRLVDTEWHLPAHVNNLIQDMSPFLHAADCIVCKAGGLMVTEALACGLPLLLVDVLPGQEEGNAAYVLSGGGGELAAEPVDALEIMCHWLAEGGVLLKERARKAKRLGHPRAAYTIAERVWQAALRGPRVKSKRQIPELSRLTELLGRRGVL